MLLFVLHPLINTFFMLANIDLVGPTRWKDGKLPGPFISVRVYPLYRTCLTHFSLFTTVNHGKLSR